jgi:hypothetical protein
MNRFLLILFASLSCFAAEPVYVGVGRNGGIVRVSANGTVEHVSKEGGYGIAVDPSSSTTVGEQTYCQGFPGSAQNRRVP